MAWTCLWLDLRHKPKLQWVKFGVGGVQQGGLKGWYYVGWVPDPPVVLTTTPLHGKFALSTTAYSVAESQGSLKVSIYRTQGRDGAVSVRLKTADGSGAGAALSSFDYTAVDQVVSWADGDFSPKTVSIPIIPRSDVVGFYTFSVSLSEPTGGASLLSSPQEATCQIKRNSHGELAFTPGQWYKQEVNPGPSNVTLTVQRNNAFKGPVSCSYHTEDGTAVAGLDYTAVSGTLSWTDGDGSSKSINVPVLFRSGAQADRDFNVVIDEPTGGVLITDDDANVIISDGAPAGTNPGVGASIKDLIVDEMFVNSMNLLLADEGSFSNRNALVMAAHGRSPSRRFNGIYAFSDQIVWAVGNLGYITKTENGGTAWVEKTSGTTRHLRAVTFVSALVGWAVGDAGTILKTTDGGTTWVAQDSTVSVDLYAVDFISSTVGWAVGDLGAVLATVDGGTTWTAVSLAAGNNMRGVAALDATHVWVVGQTGTILFWDGATWTAQTSGVTVNLNGVSAVDSTHVWACGDNGTIRFYNGTTWASQTSGVTKHLNSISMASTIVGWAVGGDGTIRKTADGSTWTTQTSQVFENLTSVWFASTSIAFLCGHSTIQKTINGGTNWTTSTSVPAIVGFGGYSNGGSGSGGGFDIIGGQDSFSPMSSNRFQGHLN
jgi:photosystem II stability/assembly factor-like uncharacterized protein